MEQFAGTGPAAILATSMGGAVACSLVEHIDIDKFVFFGPAVYSSSAWDVEFSSGFTEIIRSLKSYLDHNLDHLVSRFRGEVLFIIGERDRVIPDEVPAIYRNAFRGAKRYEEIILAGCPHAIHRWAESRPDERAKIEQMVADFVLAE